MFRNYLDANDKVKDTYRKCRSRQTVAHVLQMRERFSRFTHPMSIEDALKTIDKFVDASDPDCSVSNMNHLLQTAEALRLDGAPDWLQLTGLIHDLGKVMYLFGDHDTGTSVDEQWSVVGDTFLVGCQIPDVCVYPEFNVLNPDMTNAMYNTPNGIYEKQCGLDHCMASYGHDEYLYNVLRNHKRKFPAAMKLPEDALYIIRYHSLYPWHTGGAYLQFESERDVYMKPIVKIFQKYDLYTKEDTIYDWNKYRNYYMNIVRKYIGTEDIMW